jgi:hypothetical protein
MLAFRIHLLVTALCIGGFGCAAYSTRGPAPEPQTPQERERALADAVVAGFQWAAQNRGAGLRLAFWTSLYTHFEIRGPDVPGGPDIQELTAGAGSTVHSVLEDRVADSIAQRLQDEVHLLPFTADSTCQAAAPPSFVSTPGGRLLLRPELNAAHSCHFRNFGALLGLTNVDVRGDDAAAGIYIAYDADAGGVAKEYGAGTGSDAVCLKLARRGGVWSVSGSGSWAFDGGPPTCK